MQQITLPAPTNRWAPSFLIGAGGIIAGGLVAAIAATNPSENGIWAAAYLVLVVGVAQIGLGLGQAWIATRSPASSVVLAELALFNLGHAAVIGGTLAGRTSLVDIGGGLLIVALGMYLWVTRKTSGGWVTLGYRLMIAVVLISIPVGLVLARMAD
jgi:hypothetical protein